MTKDEIIYCNKEEFQEIESKIPCEQRLTDKWFLDLGVQNVRTLWSSHYILKDSND